MKQIHRLARRVAERRQERSHLAPLQEGLDAITRANARRGIFPVTGLHETVPERVIETFYSPVTSAFGLPPQVHLAAYEGLSVSTARKPWENT